MSEQTAPGNVPEWDVADRMRKSLRTSKVSVQAMADYLGVDRSTVSTWINGRIIPSTQTMRLWAMRTGVPLQWLRDGISGGPDGGPSTKLLTSDYKAAVTVRNRRTRAFRALSVSTLRPAA